MKRAGTPLPIFSTKEVKIIELMARGWPVKAIAAEVRLTPRTIETYKQRARRKSGTSSMIALVVYAIRHQLIHLDTCS